MGRREFHISPIFVNGQRIETVLVDDHAYEKHPDISDDVIMDLVRLLDGVEQIPESTNGRFHYFATRLSLADRQFNVVWLLEEHELYLGIITVYRDNRSKKHGLSIKKRH